MYINFTDFLHFSCISSWFLCNVKTQLKYHHLVFKMLGEHFLSQSLQLYWSWRKKNVQTYELNIYTIQHLFNSQKDFLLTAEIFFTLNHREPHPGLQGLQGHSCLPMICHSLPGNSCSCTWSTFPSSMSAEVFLSCILSPPFSCSCRLFSSTLPLSHRCHQCLWWLQPWPWWVCLRAGWHWLSQTWGNFLTACHRIQPTHYCLTNLIPK